MAASMRLASAALLVLLVHAAPALADHTIFTFRTDRFEIDGNGYGPQDGTPDVVDEFDDGSLLPTFYNAYGTAFESGGVLVLTNPGSHFPSPFGGLTDVSIAASTGGARVYGGAGDFTATSYWDPAVPPPGQSYHFTLFPTTTLGGFHPTIGIGLSDRGSGLEVEQHRTDVNQSTGAFQNTVIDFLPISAGDIAGQIGLRLDFDDTTQLVTTAYSLDGGATWVSPFTPHVISVMTTANAQLLLSADPEVGSGGTTTTTVAGSTTTTTSSTSTTLVPGSCSAAGCRRTVRLEGSKLAIKDKATDKGDSFAWKFRRGEATDLAEMGDPLGATDYEFCLSDGTGTVLMQATVPGGATCGGAPCWKATSKGFKFTDPDKTFGGIRKMLLRPGPDEASQVLVKGRGENLSLPTLPLQSLPVTVRIRASTGVCWANVFGATGVKSNLQALFKATGN